MTVRRERRRACGDRGLGGRGRGVVLSGRGGPAGGALGAGLVAAAVALAVAVRLGRTAGALPSEVATTLPGDAIVPEATAVTTRAIEIAAPPEEVWPWLVQMGYGRGGWYAIDALERALGVGDFATGGSADRIVPELQDLAVGDRMPLSEDLHLVVAHLDAPRSLVLVLPGGPLAWVWSYDLRPVYAPPGATAIAPSSPGPGPDSRGGGGARPTTGAAAKTHAARPGHGRRVVGTRLLVRTRMGAATGWVRPLLAPLEVGHLVMELVQLHRLRRRIGSADG